MGEVPTGEDLKRIFRKTSNSRDKRRYLRRASSVDRVIRVGNFMIPVLQGEINLLDNVVERETDGYKSITPQDSTFPLVVEAAYIENKIRETEVLVDFAQRRKQKSKSTPIVS